MQKVVRPWMGETPGFRFLTGSGLGGRATGICGRRKGLPRRPPLVGRKRWPDDVTGAREGQWGIVLGSLEPGDHLPRGPFLFLQALSSISFFCPGAVWMAEDGSFTATAQQAHHRDSRVPRECPASSWAPCHPASVPICSPSLAPFHTPFISGPYVCPGCDQFFH